MAPAWPVPARETELTSEMLGANLDYYILRRLAHCRNRASEADLDRLARHASRTSLEREIAKLSKVIPRFEGRFPVDPALKYLDMGCGTGGLTLALANLGVHQITGVDYLPRNIERAQAYSALVGVSGGVRFLCRDLRTWIPEERYDVLLSFDALEHIDRPREFLRKMGEFVTPNGIAVLSFGPLFHSPFGDHMWDFFVLQIPWRGLLFSEQAVLRVRRECFRPTDPAARYCEIAGGLNQMRYSEFLAYVRDTGWEFSYLSVNTFLSPPLRRLSDTLLHIPFARDFIVHNVYAVLHRAPPEETC